MTTTTTDDYRIHDLTTYAGHHTRTLHERIDADPRRAPGVDGRPNRFPAWCHVCHHRVPEGEGYLVRREGTRWLIRHDPCPEPSDLHPAERAPERPPLPDVPQGYYAVKSATGNNDLTFARVDRPTSGRWKGYTFVRQVIGGRPDTNMRRNEAEYVLAQIALAGPNQAMALYGQTIGQCGRCNRRLTDEESRRLGIGPVCRNL